MADQNVIAITGRLGQDAELRYTPDGQAILSLSVGNGVYKKGAGQYNTLTTWYRCTQFGQRAESIYNLGALVKGARVGITGQHSMRPYTDKDGNERLNCEINNCEITLLDGKSDSERQAAPQAAAKAAQHPVARKNAPQTIDDDADLPF